MKTYIREDGLFVREAPVDKHRPPHPAEPKFETRPDGSMWFQYPDGTEVYQGKFATPEMAARSLMP